MFDQLGSEIEGLEVPVDGTAIVTLLRLRDRIDAKLASALAAFDAAQLWDLDACPSLTAWLQTIAGRTRSTARGLTRTAVRLGSLPAVRAAWEAGELSTSQVDVILGTVTAGTAELFAEHEAGVVEAVAPLSIHDTTVVLREWQAKAEALMEVPPPAEEPGELHHTHTLDDRWYIKGSFGSEDGHVIDKALEQFATDDDPDAPRTPAQRRADALAEVCRFSLQQLEAPSGRRNRPHVSIVVNGEDPELAARYTETGEVVPPVLLRRLLCDAEICTVERGVDGLLNYGRTSRTAPPKLFQLLVLRDRHCCFEGCRRPGIYCEAHHIEWWEHGGETRQDNMALFCVYHHHKLHEPDWEVKRKPDGELIITSPTGKVHRTYPPGLVELGLNLN